MFAELSFSSGDGDMGEGRVRSRDSQLCRALEDQIADLIQDGKILARIDSGSQVLYKRRANLRSATFSSALRSGRAPLLRSCTNQVQLLE